MHATTLGQLSQTLSTYTGPGQSFAPVLNQALEVIYGMGTWRDLTIEGSFDCSNGYFTLPDQADTVLFASVDSQPTRVHSLWHDYRAVGTNYDSTLNFGLVDDGYRPTLTNFNADPAFEGIENIYLDFPKSYGIEINQQDGSFIEIKGVDYKADIDTTPSYAGIFGTLTSNGSTSVVVPPLAIGTEFNGQPAFYIDGVRVLFWDSGTSTTRFQYGGGVWTLAGLTTSALIGLNQLCISTATLSPVSPATGNATLYFSVLRLTGDMDIESIRFQNLSQAYDLRLDPTDSTTTFATVGPGDGVTRYRRYRVPQAQSGSFVHVLCKRRFVPVQNDDDIVYISQISILKHAMLAILAEDNADLERAEIHWGKCRQYLDEQLDQYRGPARPSLDLQLYGEGIYATRNQY
jgi:hypothetical protein